VVIKSLPAPGAPESVRERVGPGRIAPTLHADSGAAPVLVTITVYPLCCNVEMVSEALGGADGAATAAPAEPSVAKDKAMAVTALMAMFFIVDEPFMSVTGPSTGLITQTPPVGHHA